VTCYCNASLGFAAATLAEVALQHLFNISSDSTCQPNADQLWLFLRIAHWLSPADGIINSWVGICEGEQVRGIVTGTIKGKAGIDGTYTIGIWITCSYARGGVGAEMAWRPMCYVTAGTSFTNERLSPTQ
jgi:hypothetical protein